MTNYIKFLVLPFLIVLAIWAVILGHYWIWIYLVFLNGFIIVGDYLLGDDTSAPHYKYPKILTGFLYLNFPLTLGLLIFSVYMFGDETSPILENFSGFFLNTDLAQNRSQTHWWHFIGYVWTAGLLIASGSTLTGHELIHHKKNKRDVFVGNWCLALSWDCAFGVEHVHGHHKNVGTKTDPATASEGQNPFLFFFTASLQEHRDAWKIEFDRLKRRGVSFFSFHNQLLVGYIRSGIITVLFYYIGGLSGIFLFACIAVTAKLVLEVVNYMEHYGLVRVPGTPVESRHSWNSTKKMSSLLLYNLTRHSHHHEKGSLEFWKLRPFRDAPKMPFGYLTTLYLIIFFPWKYRLIMADKLDHWFLQFATDEEKTLRPVI